MARSLRQLSTQCGKCSVVFDEEHPKQHKRALCKACYTIDAQRTSREQRERRAEVGAAVNRVAIYKDYKMENRQGFWKDINKQIRTLTKREDIRAFLSKQMDRILADDNLMKYLNSVTMAERRNEYRNNK